MRDLISTAKGTDKRFEVQATGMHVHPEDTYPVFGDAENPEADPRDAALTGSCEQTHGKLYCACNGVM